MKTAATALVTLAASVFLLAFGGCSDDGAVGTCGNGRCEPSETAQNCFEDCGCGNAIVNNGEDCDATDLAGETCRQLGYLGGTLACNADCRLDTTGCRNTAICGDSMVEADEVCDDGNTTDGDGCSGDCLSDETCGNLIVDTAVGEACDDGNHVSGDGCRDDCASNETCGNGWADTAVGEECDDGNNVGGDGCGPTCRFEHCGNGIVDVMEECDDGNIQDGDGCSADCKNEDQCGNGYANVAGGESCDGTDLAGETCSGLGYSSGQLGCTATCDYNTSGCYTCGNGICEPAEDPGSCASDCSETSDVDLLLVVDNSAMMAQPQSTLGAQMITLLNALRDPVLGLPDLHIGMTTTDLGTAPFQITFCEVSDEGNLMTHGCPQPTGQPYVIDIAPSGCVITRDVNGNCTADDCAQANCAEGTLTHEAGTNCPRCRNFSPSTLDAVLDCLINADEQGCGFEQPLEAMRLALNNNPNNTGFLRSGSVLAVLFLTSEDDCSASTSDLFDTSQNDINAPLGFLHSFRCFEFGVTCDINDRTVAGLRQNCAPREDTGAMLHFISEYETFLNLIRDPGKLVVAAIAGPNDDSTVEVQPDTNGRPTVQPSCGTGTLDGIPGIRMRSFVEGFNPVPDLVWAYSSICAADYTAALSGIGQAIRDRLH